MKVEKIDWNDSMPEFIRVKLEHPQVLAQLVKRQHEYAQRKSTQHKIEVLRKKFEQLSANFGQGIEQFEEKAQYKKELQRQVIRTGSAIKKMEVELQKLVKEPQGLPNRHSSKDYKEEATRVSFDSDEIHNKKYQEELTVILADQNQLRSHLKQYIEDQVAKRVKLTQSLEQSTTKLQKLIEQRDIKDKFQQSSAFLKQITLKLEQETKAKKNLLVRLSQEEERNSMLRFSRQDYDNRLEDSNKKIQNFTKACKKMLMSDEGRESKKYKEFVKKYRTYSKEEQEALVKKYKNIADRNIGSFSPERKTEKYEELVVQVMKKFSNKTFTPDEFTNLENNCVRIGTYLEHLIGEDQQLSSEVESLQENLLRKNRELEEVRKSMSPTTKSRFL